MVSLPPGARIAIAGSATAVAVGLLMAYPTSTGRSASSPAAASAPPAAARSAPAPDAGGPAPSAPSAPAPSSDAAVPGTAAPEPPAAVTHTGEPASTRWGDVQVEVAVADGRIVGAVAVRVPDEDRESRAINAEAVPVLEAETLSVQSADVDTVSGATITSDGYRESLQSALDQAAL